MATVNAELGQKDIVSPTKGRYNVRYVWVLDQRTKRPVNVRVVHVFS